MLTMRRRLADLAFAFHRDERGQVLMFFIVGIITIFLAVAAVGIDTGFWFGRRAYTQNAADMAARGGAVAQMGYSSGSCVPASPACLVPCREAANTAILNGVAVSNLNACDDGPSDTIFTAYTDNGQRCVEAVVDTTAPSMFSGIVGIDSLQIGSKASACAGTVRGIQAFAGNNGPDGIAVVLGPTGNRDCFNGNQLRIGFECVIWGAIDEGGTQHNRLLWTDEEDCSGSVSGSTSQISTGVGWKCDEASNDEAETTEVNSVADNGVDQDDVLFAFRTRLQGSTTCASLEAGAGPAQSFRNAFGRADGQQDTAQPPPPLPGGASARNAIYTQNDCFNNPRIVIMPITLDSGASGGDKDVDGFAVVYLTGCYDRSAPLPEPNPNAETNTCSGASLPNPNQQDDSRDCGLSGGGGGYTPSAFCRVEIRGVPVRVFLTSGAIGALGAMTNPNFPLTIQTVE